VPTKIINCTILPKSKSTKKNKNLKHAFFRLNVYPPKGASITLETLRYGRWKCEYNGKPTPPYTCSKMYGDESVISQRDALLFVLRWLWDAHTNETGEVCPYRLI
jgi:hypothetical protein